MTEQDRQHYQTRLTTIRAGLIKMQGIMDAGEPTEVALMVCTSGQQRLMELVLLPSAKECGEKVADIIFSHVLNGLKRAEAHLESCLDGEGWKHNP